MLVLSRRLNESIQIGPDIWVKVVRIDRNQIRLGIEAPADVTIQREENLPQDWEMGDPLHRPGTDSDDTDGAAA